MAVAFVSAGAGNRATGSSATLSTSWSHTIATSGPDTVVLIGVVQSFGTNADAIAPVVTYGGYPTLYIAFQDLGSSTNRAHTGVFALWNPPTGTQTVSVAGVAGTTKAAIAGQSVAYSGVKAFSTNVNALATSAAVSSVTSSMIFALHSNGASLTAVSGTNRYAAGSSVTGVGDYIRVQDAVGTGGSVTMSATGTASTPGTIAIQMLPLAAPSGSQIVLRDASSYASTASGSSLTWNHTCSGADRALVVGVTTGGAASTASVTYDGVAMTQLLGGTTNWTLFGLLNPNPGTHSVVVTPSTANSIAATAASYVGVDSFGTAQSNVDTLSVTAQADGMAVASNHSTSALQTNPFPQSVIAMTAVSSIRLVLSDAYGTGSAISFDRAGSSRINGVDLVPLSAIPEGTAAGGYTWSSGAVGRKPSKGSSSGGYTWASAATGKSNRSATSGGVYLWTAAAQGKSTPKAATSGEYNWDTGSVGDAEYRGQATGAYTWAGGATGLTPVDVPTGRGDYGWGGTSTGYSPRRGTAAAAYTWASAAAGKASPTASAGIADYSWAGAATGSRPVRGSASGAYRFELEEAIGYRSGSAFGSGTYKWIGLGSGLFIPKPAAGVVGWVAE